MILRGIARIRFPHVNCSIGIVTVVAAKGLNLAK